MPSGKSALPLTVEHDGAVALVTLDRPHAMNALSGELRNALRDTFMALSNDDSVRAIVLTGAGERAFCAGLDLKELGQDAAVLAFEDEDFNPVKHIAGNAKPVIGAVNGVAVTGGFELALACDILIASTNARFADTHSRVGLLPSWGLSQILQRTVGPFRARDLSLTARFLDAQTACAWGLVSEVVPLDRLVSRAMEIAQQVAESDPAALQPLRQVINSGGAMSLSEALAFEEETARDYNGRVGPIALERRRTDVIERNRNQG